MSAPVPHKPATEPRTITARVVLTAGSEPVEVILPAAAATRWGVVRFKQVPGTAMMTAELRTWTQWYRLTAKPRRDLGLPFHWQWYVVMGLLGKFFKVRRPSPQVTLIHVGSLMEHLEATADADYWTPENLERVREARKSYNNREHYIVMEGRAARKRRNPRPVEDKAAAAATVVKTRRPPPPPHPELF